MSHPRFREPWLPKIALSWLIGLVTFSAIVMAVVHQAVTTQATWAVLATAAIASVLLPLLFYVGSFALASLFSVITSSAADHLPSVVHLPTTTMPDRPQ